MSWIQQWLIASYKSTTTSTLLTWLISFWKLDESIWNAADSVGSVTLTNTWVTYTASKINNWWVFNSGSTTNLNWWTSASLELTTNISISFWVNITWDWNDFARVISKWLINSRWFFFYKNPNATDNINFQIQWTSKGSAAALSRSTWHHVVWTYDWANMKLYINWTKESTDQAKTWSITYSSDVFYIWKDSWPTSRFTWWVDAVWIWNIALSQAQVNDLYNWWSWIQYPF